MGTGRVVPVPQAQSAGDRSRAGFPLRFSLEWSSDVRFQSSLLQMLGFSSWQVQMLGFIFELRKLVQMLGFSSGLVQMLGFIFELRKLVQMLGSFSGWVGDEKCELRNLTSVIPELPLN